MNWEAALQIDVLRRQFLAPISSGRNQQVTRILVPLTFFWDAFPEDDCGDQPIYWTTSIWCRFQLGMRLLHDF